MERVIRVVLLCLGMASGFGASAPPKTQITLLLSHASAEPGETITAALRMSSEPGWHTYWRNPGDAGIPTEIEWSFSTTMTAGAIQWPVPHKLVLAKLFAYVYEKEVLLLIPLSVGVDAKAGTAQIRGKVSWLECDDKTCVPQDGEVQASILIGGDSKPSESAALIEQWRGRLPKKDPAINATGSWESAGSGEARPLIIEWKPGLAPGKPDFFPFDNSLQGQTEVLEATPQKVRLRKVFKSSDGAFPEKIDGLVVNDVTPEFPEAFEVELRISGGAAVAGAKPSAGAAVQLPGAAASSSIWMILGLAFVGGLILNIMPCVLPVIALKILGFVNQSREEPKRVRELGIIYMLGVLASFLALAGAVIAVRSAGGDVNWGMQMQNRYFVVAMTVLVTLVALNLWGVFELNVSGRALGAASELASREGRGGAFYNGVLATLLATPCTAPALAFAVGAVLTQPSHRIIATFLMVGLGLAFPYVLLSWNPRWLKLLPKPGPWMERFKHAMGFPMAATAIWLLSVASLHFAGSGTLWLGLFLVCLAAGAWVYGEFVQRGAKHRWLAGIVALLFVFGGYAYALETKLDWRKPRLASASGLEPTSEPGGIPWRKWSPEAVEKARAEGHPVLVDFTAAWCLTCQWNKESSLEIEPVRKKLAEMGAVAFLADFTLRDKTIGQEIKRFNRAGVPLVVVYPADQTAAPIVLPEILTPGIVLRALDMAAKGGGTRSTAAQRPDRGNDQDRNEIN